MTDKTDNIKEEKSEQILFKKVVRGGIWVFSLRIINQLLKLFRIIILARILAPHDFGLMGIALLTMSILETFSQTGFQQALIQKKDEIESYLNSTWTVLILRGLILFSILYFIAPITANFFNVPEAKSIIQVIGFSILFQAFTNISVIYFQKELEFNKQFVYQISGTLADFTVAVSAVFILKNVWALVFGALAGNFVSCIVSFIIGPYKPRLSLDLGKIKELFGFGKWVLGSSVLIFLITQGDDIFVGKLLGVTVLGFYQMAYKISNLPATEITHVISQITFPAYSKLQDDISRLRIAYLKVLQLTAFLSLPIAGLIFVLAPDFTKIFLGEKWMPMVPAMKVLCIFGATRAIAATGGPIVLSLGKPVIQTIMSFFNLILLVSIIYPLTIKFGILGTSLAVLLSFTIILIPGQIINCRLINLRFLDWVRPIILPIISSVVMIGVIFVIRLNLITVSLIIFIFLVALGIFIFLIEVFLLWKGGFLELKNS